LEAAFGLEKPMDRNLFASRLFLALCQKLITPSEYLVGRAMLRRACRKGVLWPSHGRLARDAGNRSTKTVQRAKAKLRALGFISWQNRRLTWNRQDTCLYQLSCPSKPLPVSNLPSLSKTKYINGLSSSVKLSTGFSPRPGLDDALARLGASLGVPVEEAMPWLKTS
jgi:hypothetical protein